MLMLMLLCPDAKGTEGGGDPTPTPEGKKEKESEPSNVELAKAFKELKENSVPKEDYEKVKKENQELVAQIINGDGAGNGQANAPEDLEGDIKALREKLYGPKCSELSNLEFCDATLKLREAIIKRDGIDPFVPRGANIKPTDYDTQRAQAVADVMAECIKEANGDSGVFTALLQAKTNNDSPALVAHLKKVGALK
jgi:hypothetical protein